MPTLAGECIPAGASFPIADVNNILGGSMQVADSTARLAVHSSRRRVGMRVWQIDTGAEYTLIGGIADGNWAEIKKISNASPEGVVTGCFQGQTLAQVATIGDGSAVTRVWVFNGTVGANTGWA